LLFFEAISLGYGDRRTTRYPQLVAFSRKQNAREGEDVKCGSIAVLIAVAAVSMIASVITSSHLCHHRRCHNYCNTINLAITTTQ
jgi:hypothetical protein